MEDRKVYHVVVDISDAYGKLRVRLFFPSAQLRKLFCSMHRTICSDVGRRPIIATQNDLDRTRLNLAFYSQLRDFVPIWDQQINR